MAFADAAFDGWATLEGVEASRAPDLRQLTKSLALREAIPVYVRPIGPLLKIIQPDVVVDARMRKHADPEVQRGLAPLTLGLGPGLVAGQHADVVIETSWEQLGAVITEGTSLPLAGEPRALGGHSRDRYVYAPFDGIFRTKFRIGDPVSEGQEIAEIDSSVLTAPLGGVLRGLTRDNVAVTFRTKVIEVDPRGPCAEVQGIGQRPRRIAESALSVIRGWERRPEA
jgi:xanthine dehydrogenase accessory factor